MKQLELLPQGCSDDESDSYTPEPWQIERERRLRQKLIRRDEDWKPDQSKPIKQWPLLVK